MAPARSEAMNTATLPTSASVVRKWVRVATLTGWLNLVFVQSVDDGGFRSAACLTDVPGYFLQA